MDKRLLGPHFAGPSWDRWKAVGKAIFVEPMAEQEIALFREVAERDPPEKPVSEAVAIVGRGGGKNAIASAIAIKIALGDYRERLRPGEHAVVMCIATNREQAKIAHAYIRSSFEECPALVALLRHVDDDAIELANRVIIEVHTNSYRSVRGRSIIAAIFDETSFWRDETSANPDVEVYGAVRPGLARMPGSKLVLITSAYKRSGLAYQRWKDHYGCDDSDVLVVKGSTLQFNPSFDASVIEADLARDPALYGAEYNSEWRDDLATYLDRELVDSAVNTGVVVRPPSAGAHFAFADPSGGRGDSFTVAVCHREGDLVVLDLLYEKRAPFNPTDVVGEIEALLKSYSCSRLVGDKYAAQWVVDAFAKVGIKYVASERDRSAIYLDALPLFSAGRVRLLDNHRLVAQLCALERRTFANGRDRVDHGRGGADDLSNSVCGTLVLATEGASMDAWVEFYRRMAEAAKNGTFAERYSDVGPAAERRAVRIRREREASRLARKKAEEAPPVRMKSMRPHQYFCTSGGVRYQSNENCVVIVASEDVQQMKTMLCLEER
jgi:hypothetical protein